MKNRTYIILLIVFWGCSRQTPQKESVSNPKVDSIQKLINFAKTTKELTLRDKKAYLTNAELLTKELKQDTVQLKQLSEISLAYKKLEDSLEFRRTNAMVLKMSQNLKENTVLGYSHWDLASFFNSYGVTDSSFYHYKKALSSFEQLPADSTAKSLKGRMYYSMARLQDSYKDYLGGEISATAAIKIFDELEDNYRLYNSYSALGMLANGMGNSDKALNSYEKAREYLDKAEISNKNKVIWQNQNNIASVYLNTEDFANAKQAYQQLLSSTELKEN